MAEVSWSALILITLWTVDRQSINTRFHREESWFYLLPLLLKPWPYFLIWIYWSSSHLHLVHTSLFKICCHLFWLLVFYFFKKKKQGRCLRDYNLLIFPGCQWNKPGVWDKGGLDLNHRPRMYGIIPNKFLNIYSYMCYIYVYIIYIHICKNRNK